MHSHLLESNCVGSSLKEMCSGKHSDFKWALTMKENSNPTHSAEVAFSQKKKKRRDIIY